MRRKNVSGLLKSLLQAGLYLVDQPESAVRDVRDRVQSTVSTITATGSAMRAIVSPAMTTPCAMC